jgi:hypothetical protein
MRSPGASLWTALSPAGGSPSGRTGHALAYDAANNRAIVFGGLGNSACSGVPPLFNDVWVLANADGTAPPAWAPLAPAGTPPARRAGPAAAYDPASNRLIVFGGDPSVGYCYGALNDVWVLTHANGLGGTPAWTPLAPIGTPPNVRQSPEVVYDTNSGRLIIYGGNQNACQPYNSGDVWVLANANGLGGTPTWTQLAPIGPAPAPRVGHAMVYDSPNDRLIVFAGVTETSLTNDVWVLSHATGLGGTPVWTRLTPSGSPPLPRAGHSATYDAVNNRLLTFGGNVQGGGPTNEVWMLTGANGLGGASEWVRLSPGGSLPPGRRSHRAFFNGCSRRLTVYGGDNCAVFGDLWALADANGDPPNNAPVAVCRPVAILAGTNSVVEASVDAGSFDPDCDAIAFAQSPAGPYPRGTTLVTLQVSDSRGGSNACAAAVLVGNPPEITGQPQSVTAPAGTNLVLTLTATSEVPLTYQWLGDGTAIPAATNDFLVLSNATTSQSGLYAVIAANVFGAVTSQVAVVAVLAPPAIITSPVSQSLQPAGTVTLSVNASGSGPLAYQWFLNGTAITGATSSSYEINAAQFAEAGNYTVTVSNPVGTVTSSPATVWFTELATYAGITIYGPVGATFQIQCANNLLESTAWTTVTNITLPASPFLFLDLDSKNRPQRFYRSVLLP